MRTKITFSMAVKFLLCSIMILTYTQITKIASTFLANFYDYPSLDSADVFIKNSIQYTIIGIFAITLIYIISRLNYMDFKIAKSKEKVSISPYILLLIVATLFSLSTYIAPSLSVFQHTINYPFNVLTSLGIYAVNGIIIPISTTLMYFALPITVLSHKLDRKKYQRTPTEIAVSTLIYTASFVSVSITNPYVD